LGALKRAVSCSEKSNFYLKRRSSFFCTFFNFFLVPGVGRGDVMFAAVSGDEDGLIFGGRKGKITTGSVCTSTPRLQCSDRLVPLYFLVLFCVDLVPSDLC